MKRTKRKSDKTQSIPEEMQEQLPLNETVTDPSVINFTQESANLSREKRISGYRGILKSDRFYEDQIEM